MEAALVLVLFLVALVLFISEKVPVDFATLIILAVLMLSEVLTPAEAFSRFASEIIVILGFISIICGALQRAGILVESLASFLLRLAGRSPWHLAALLMTTAVGVSAFMNNTTVTAMLLPATDSMGSRSGVPASKFMMPLAFGSILGGTCTLIGTSTNVAVSGYLAKAVMRTVGPIGNMAVLAAFFLLTILLTQPMSNAAAALVVLPVALDTASQLGADPRTFGIAIMMAASISFITPFEPSCLLVYGPGRYRFRDFFLVGGGLTLLLACVVVPLISVFWSII